jgi:hypothetical protein
MAAKKVTFQIGIVDAGALPPDIAAHGKLKSEPRRLPVYLRENSGASMQVQVGDEPGEADIYDNLGEFMEDWRGRFEVFSDQGPAAEEEPEPDPHREVRDSLERAQAAQSHYWDALHELEQELQDAFGEDGDVVELENDDICEGISLEDLCERLELDMEVKGDGKA